ncbi:MAG: hypothetical protein IKR73_07965, partial [Oscillospiraceae bacterium]|nr:hypothetical protein [Oscillospiraceae bacterium]
GDDLLEAMILLERRGKAPHGADMTTATSYIVPKEKRASDADSFKEFMATLWRGAIHAITVIVRSKLVVVHSAGSFEVPFIVPLLLLMVGRFIAVIILLITLLTGVRYSIKVRE